MSKVIDETGNVYGRLTVINAKRDENGQLRWLCKCTCGRDVLVRGNSLRTGNTKSCGVCTRRESAAARREHAVGEEYEYAAWRRMLFRCSAAHEHADRYTDRGIKVCDAWRGHGGFHRFLADVGPAPGKGYELDRVDNNGNYEPGNVRWATRQQQMRNTSANVKITAFNETHTVAEWSELLQLNPSTVYSRVARGEQGELALRQVGDHRE